MWLPRPVESYIESFWYERSTSEVLENINAAAESVKFYSLNAAKRSALDEDGTMPSVTGLEPNALRSRHSCLHVELISHPRQHIHFKYYYEID